MRAKRRRDRLRIGFSWPQQTTHIQSKNSTSCRLRVRDLPLPVAGAGEPLMDLGGGGGVWTRPSWTHKSAFEGGRLHKSALLAYRASMQVFPLLPQTRVEEPGGINVVLFTGNLDLGDSEGRIPALRHLSAS